MDNVDGGEDALGPALNGPMQLRKARANGWTIARRTAFLEELATSCNVGRALNAAGMGSGGVYRLRLRDPEFAQQWHAALEIGYQRLETALLRRAIEAVDDLTLDEPQEVVVKMTVAEATAVMRIHSTEAARGEGRRRRPSERQVATQQEVDALLIQRIRMVQRRHRTAAAKAGAAKVEFFEGAGA